MTERYIVDLSDNERGLLEAFVAGGKASARRIKRAQILLAAATGCACC